MKAKAVKKTVRSNASKPRPKKDDLKMVIAVRHGEYKDYGDKGLDEFGRQQSETLAQKLHAIIARKHSVAVLYSPATRAMQTAKIIGAKLGSKARVLDELASDEFDDSQTICDAMLKAVNGVNVIVAVGHFEVPSGIVHIFSRMRFKKDLKRKECGNGNGFMINLRSGKVVNDLLAHRA